MHAPNRIHQCELDLSRPEQQIPVTGYFHMLGLATSPAILFSDSASDEKMRSLILYFRTVGEEVPPHSNYLGTLPGLLIFWRIK